MPTLEARLEVLAQTPLGVMWPLCPWECCPGPEDLGGTREAGQLVDNLVSVGTLPSSRCSPGWQLKDLEGALEWELGPYPGLATFLSPGLSFLLCLMGTSLSHSPGEVSAADRSG